MRIERVGSAFVPALENRASEQGAGYAVLWYDRYAHGKFDYAVDGAGMSYADDFTDSAWTVGLGIERKINERVSLFGEWEFRQFGKSTLSDAAAYSTRATPEHHHIRAGMNIQF
ncbi:autotransporter outer membrane beta-barrel domain-containing protein [Paracoccus pantotrophus]|nr:autotransporter outer membrane beta-barrel domain-containing protein [Paracoccus pantotrophus]